MGSSTKADHCGVLGQTETINHCFVVLRPNWALRQNDNFLNSKSHWVKERVVILWKFSILPKIKEAVIIVSAWLGTDNHLVQNIWIFSPLVPSRPEKNILVLLSLYIFWGKCVDFSIFEVLFWKLEKECLASNFQVPCIFTWFFPKVSCLC